MCCRRHNSRDNQPQSPSIVRFAGRTLIRAVWVMPRSKIEGSRGLQSEGHDKVPDEVRPQRPSTSYSFEVSEDLCKLYKETLTEGRPGRHMHSDGAAQMLCTTCTYKSEPPNDPTSRINRWINSTFLPTASLPVQRSYCLRCVVYTMSELCIYFGLRCCRTEVWVSH